MPVLTKTPHGADLLASDAPTFVKACDTALESAKASIAQLKTLPAGSDAKVLSLYDDATATLANIGQRSGLAREVHPLVAFREAAEACEQRIEAFNVELAQDRGVYDALSKVDSKSLDPVSAFWLFRTLRDFRRAAVDRDEPTRNKVKALNEELVKIGQAFGRNIRDDVKTIQVDPRDLEGLPADWLADHKPDAKGVISITTNTPDYVPVMTYCKNGKVRETLWRAYRNRAFPANVEVLNSLLSKRAELASLLGYESWAAYTTETKMVKTAQAAADFIERGRLATETRAKADYAMLLTRKKKDAPAATSIEPWEQDFYEDRVRNEQFGLDSQALRSYFEYNNVRQGIIDITSKMFGIRYVPVADAKVWHADVETFDVMEGDTLLGRIHLDMHPREGKYKHAAQFGMTTGRAGVELPEGVLVCNFPRGGGLLQHGDVETFFHEFGHLLHAIFSGRQARTGVSGISTEWDFVEAPSMLLQEWPLDAKVLQLFAKHSETGAPIPELLVKQLKAAKEFGVGLSTRRQFFLAAVSLEFHARKPGFETSAVLKELQEKFAPFRREWAENTHFELGFGHLDGYSAAYYTYLWSTVIAKDMLTKFSPDMMNSSVARQYRKSVLEPGGSKEASALVQEFLGRPYDFKAFETWLNASH